LDLALSECAGPTNPYRELVEKYEALLEVHRQPLGQKSATAAPTGAPGPATAHVERQLHPVPEHVLLLRVGRYEEPDLARPGQVERVAIEAVLRRLRPRVVVRAEVQLEPAHMVGGQLDLDLQLLAGHVPARHDALAVLAAGLVRPGRPQMVRVAAHATVALVLLPLDRVPAAEQLVVVVVDRVREAEAPHRIAGGRFHQPAVGVRRPRPDRHQQQQQQQQHRGRHQPSRPRHPSGHLRR
uniref:Uncharacterized protein n=1 Tax=Anopheles coluzzii TaxID=1518534 RepID=A0A8W7Q0J2_ANOCL